MEVKTIEIKDDILTFYVQTESFPEIPGTFDKLEEKINGFDDRNVYGVSWCDGEKLIFRACVKEASDGEGDKQQLPYYTIPKGKYLYTTLNDWRQNLPQITKIFDELMKHPDINKNSIAVEDYRTPDEMLIMVQHK